jgi:MFS family permease
MAHLGHADIHDMFSAYGNPRDLRQHPWVTPQRPNLCENARVVEDTDTRVLLKARWATSAAFFSQGLVLISLTTRLPGIQERWDIGETALSIVLLGMILMAGVGSVLTETLARRTESAVTIRVGLVIVALGVAGSNLLGNTALSMAAMVIYGFGLGIVDAAGNMQAVALEHRYGRSIMPSFYSAWSLGGLMAAVFTLFTAHLSLHIILVVLLVPLATATLPFLKRIGDPLERSRHVDIPWRPIVLVGLAMVIFYSIDTAAFTWGPLYLEHVFSTPDSLVALAALVYLAACIASRAAGDKLVDTFGVVPVLRVGSLIGCAALVVIVVAPNWQIAVLGFTALGLGVAFVAPLSFSAAARIAGDSADLTSDERMARVDAVIGRFNQFNYLGALIGSVMTGLVGAGNLRLGFVVPTVAILALLPLARFFAWQPPQAK